MDLDSLSSRALTPPHFTLEAFAGLESGDWVGAGVIGVPCCQHWLPAMCLSSIADSFDASEWGTNGPKLLTRMLAKR